MRVLSTCLPFSGWETGLFLNCENLHWTKWFRYGNENSLALHSIHMMETSKEREQKFLCFFRIFSVEKVIKILACTFFCTFYFCVWMDRQGDHFFPPPFPCKRYYKFSQSKSPYGFHFHLTQVSRASITIFPQYHKDLNHQKPIFPPKEAICPPSL